MKKQSDKNKAQDSKDIVISNEYNGVTQCNECDINFKSEYHLENHIKSSQHLINTGINRKFSYKLNQKTTKTKLLKGALKSPLLKELKSSCAVLNFSLLCFTSN